MIKAGIVGGTGYTGVELMRLLVSHPNVELSVVTSRSEAGHQVSDLFPNLRGHLDTCFAMPQLDELSECDVVFFATPNGTAMGMVPELLEAGVKVIDLAADFRLKDPDEWKQWYDIEHACPEVLAEAVYGLPEINREAIAGARLVANPGCYPTAVALGFLPLLENGLVDDQHLIADAKSGVSGAGRNAKVGSLLCEASENFMPYGVDGHRHLPEIRQTLSEVVQHAVGLTFVPHLTPMIRGIEASLYARVSGDLKDLQALYEQRYRDESFVDVLPAGTLPQTRSVKGSNMCRISVFRPQMGDTVVVSSVIDNLVKGAAGQAIQNMNIVFGLGETTGIDTPAFLP
jgi:N-acetyl-gamma-glutamyl-phosphate reductase